MTHAFRVKLWDTTGAGRGRGSLKAIIDDAKNVGGEEIANGAGSGFFTLPYNHPQIGQVNPLTTHYSFERWNDVNGAYQPIYNGLITDYDATSNEVVFYGTDYLGLLKGTITASGTSYTNAIVTSVVTAQFAAAIAESNSRLGFLSSGTIDSSTVSVTLLTAYEERLHFLAGLMKVQQANGTTRPMIYIAPRTNPIQYNFQTNRGTDQADTRLEFGGNIHEFRYRPYADFATRVFAIGVKRQGASVLYSTQTYASEATYGWVAKPAIFEDVIDQTALDNITQHAARVAGRVGQQTALIIQANTIYPFVNYDLGDAVKVVINRGPVSVAGLFTVWGVRWQGNEDGSEITTLQLLPKDT